MCVCVCVCVYICVCVDVKCFNITVAEFICGVPVVLGGY